MEPLKPNRHRAQIRGFTVLLLVCALLAFARSAAASPQLNPACPFDFFTNVASRLLSSQLNVDLAHIQIYPTNQYTPAVHRLLQVTANILDATTTNYYPSAFRPLFWKTNEDCGGIWQTDIYITGYQYVQEPLASDNPPIFNTPMDPSDAKVPVGLSGFTNNIYGIPWVIGVKKGLPNFNGFELDNTVFIERELQFNRNNNTTEPPSGNTFPYGRIYTTNQMYLIGISNAFAMDDWNSYLEPYSNQVTIYAQDTLSVGLTNSDGFVVANLFATNVWNGVTPGITVQPWPAQAFLMPFGTNITVEQNLSFAPTPASANGLYVYYPEPTEVQFGGYSFTGPCFIPSSLDPSNFLDMGTPPLPQFGMVTTNHLQAYMLDTDQQGNIHILDYVQLASMDSSLNVNAAILDNDDSGLWSTNSYSTGSTTPWGVVNQYLTSSIGGRVPVEDGDGSGSGGTWAKTPVPGTGGDSSPAAQQAFFSAFLSANDTAFYNGAVVTNVELSMLAPFTPMREIVQRYVFQANDPLVHYLNSDLNDINDDTTNRVAITAVQTNTIHTIGYLNDRYLPWGSLYPGSIPNAGGAPDNLLLPTTIIFGNPAQAVALDENQFNFAYKDPLVWSSDDWNFPTNQTLNASWLGQVHRGTPWQTIYLKSTNILQLAGSGAGAINGLATWALWTGDMNPSDAASMAPVNDWQIAGLLASLFNTNNESSLFSPNDPNPNDWENLLNGMTVLTNDLGNYLVIYGGLGFATVTISSNSIQAADMADAVESARASSPGYLFPTPGSIFAVPQLSDDSPYLNLNDAQIDYGISEQAYEAIPDQLLPLLRVDSIGSMLAANGQVVIQFTGADNHAYAVQSSPDLINWTTISTNCPYNDVFTFTNNVTPNAQFYRTVLLY